LSLNFQYRHLFSSDGLFGRVTDFVSHDTTATQQVYAALEASANIARFSLADGQAAQMHTPWNVPESAGTAMRPLDLEISGEGTAARLIVSGVEGRIETAVISTNGALLAGTALTPSGGVQSFTNQITQIEVSGRLFAATANRDDAGLQIYQQTAPTMLPTAPIWSRSLWVTTAIW